MENKKTQQKQNQVKQTHANQIKTPVKSASIKKEKLNAKSEHVSNSKMEKRS